MLAPLGTTGSYFDTGSSRASFPSSTSCRMTVAVIVLVTLPMRMWFSAAVGVLVARSPMPMVCNQVPWPGTSTSTRPQVPAVPSFSPLEQRLECGRERRRVCRHRRAGSRGRRPSTAGTQRCGRNDGPYDTCGPLAQSRHPTLRRRYRTSILSARTPAWRPTAVPVRTNSGRWTPDGHADPQRGRPFCSQSMGVRVGVSPPRGCRWPGPRSPRCPWR